MDREGELSNALYNVIKKLGRGSVVVDATIMTVDETAFTCEVEITNTGETPTHFFDVPLRVLISAQASFVEIPKVGTKCLICFRDSNINRPQIIGIHEALKILVKCDNIVFNDGTLGGMVKLQEAVNEYNEIKQDLNTLKSVFTSWVVNPGDGGAALKSAAATWAGQQLQLTQPADLENPKIKQ